MLTIKEPVQLKSRLIAHNGDGFYRRISDNYLREDNELSSEELMHLFTTPPEIVYAEGDVSNFFTSNLNQSNHTEQRIEILNNVINRILLNAEGHMTYQDRIYISKHLNRLGIKDQQTFMKTVHMMLKEHTESIESLENIKDNVIKLEKQIPEVMRVLAENITKSDDKSPAESELLYLQDRIFKRLKTRDIYDTLWKYKEYNSQTSYINTEKLRMSEQHKLERYMELQSLETRVLGTYAPLELFHEDKYEISEYDASGEFTEEIIRNSLTQSSLLSLLEQIIEARDTFISNNNSIAIEADTLYSLVDNTIDRYVENIYNPTYYVPKYDITYQKITGEVLDYLDTEVNDGATSDYASEGMIEQYIKNLNSNMVDNSRYTMVDNKNDRVSVINNAPQYSLVDNAIDSYIENINNPTHSIPNYDTNYQNIKGEALDYLDTKVNEESDSDNAPEGIINQYIKNLNSNRVDNSRFNKVDNTANRVSVINNESKDEHGIVREADAHYDNSVDMTYTSEMLVSNNITEAINTINEMNIDSGNRYILAMQHLEERMKQRSSQQGSGADHRKESLEALENPVAFIHRVEEEHDKYEMQARIIRQEVLDKLSPQSRKYVELIDKYIVNPSAQDRYIMEHSDPFGELRRDIMRVRLENTKASVTEEVAREEIVNAVNETVTEIRNESYRANVRVLEENKLEEAILQHKTTEQLNEEAHLERIEELRSINSLKQRAVNETVNDIRKEIHRNNVNTVAESNYTQATLVHKNVEQINEEEILEQIEELRNMNSQKQKVVNENIEETTKVERNVNSSQVVSEIIDDRKLTEMVRSQVQGHLGELSDQVFRKLEVKLANEKKRRGY